jgi:hypothetical protein
MPYMLQSAYPVIATSQGDFVLTEVRTSNNYGFGSVSYEVHAKAHRQNASASTGVELHVIVPSYMMFADYLEEQVFLLLKKQLELILSERRTTGSSYAPVFDRSIKDLLPSKNANAYGEYRLVLADLYSISDSGKHVVLRYTDDADSTLDLTLPISQAELDRSDLLIQKVEQELLERLCVRSKIAKATKATPTKPASDKPFGIIRPKSLH